MYFGLFIFISNKTFSGLIVLLFHIVCHIIEAFIVSWDELCYSLLIEAHVLCEQPSCHNSFDLAVFFKFTYHQDQETDDYRSATKSPGIITVTVNLVAHLYAT